MEGLSTQTTAILASMLFEPLVSFLLFFFCAKGTMKYFNLKKDSR